MNACLIIGSVLVAFLLGGYFFTKRKKEDDFEISDDVAKQAFEVIRGKTIGLFHNSHSQSARSIFYELKMLLQIKGVAISDQMSNADAIVYINEDRNQVNVTISAPMVDSQPAFNYKISKVLPSSNMVVATIFIFVKLAEFFQHK